MDERGLEITHPLDRPYLTGLAAGDEEAGIAWTMGQVVLNGRPYLVDRKDGSYSRRSVRPITMERSERTGENAATDAMWRRSFQSYHMGAGQVFVDRDFSNQYRYSDSRGVNPWNEYFLSLLNDVTRLSSYAGALAVVKDGKELVVAHDTRLTWFTESLGVDTVTLPDEVVSAASDGTSVWVVLADGRVGSAFEPGPPEWKTYVGDLVGCVKGRVIVTHGREVFEVTSGAAELVWVHPDPAWTWTAIGDGLTAVYMAGRAGDKSGVYRFRSKEDGTGLDVGIQAAQLPDGETAVHVGYYMGYSVVGTTAGVRFGASDSQGNLSLGRVIGTPFPVRCSEGQGNYIWFGWSDIDDLTTGLGRMDPSRFTDPLTPAYAPDLMADGSGEVLAVTTWKGLRVFSVEGRGTFIEDPSRLVESGWIDEGFTSWNTPDAKSGAYVNIRYLPLRGEIEVQAYTETNTPRTVGTAYKQGSTQSENFSLEGVLFSGLSIRTILRRDSEDMSKGPVLTRTELRAVPVAGRISLFTVPIVVSSSTQYQGSTTWFKAPEEVERLAELVESGQMFIYREGARAWRVVASEYEWKPEKMTGQESGWSGTFTIQLTEVF